MARALQNAPPSPEHSSRETCGSHQHCALLRMIGRCAFGQNPFPIAFGHYRTRRSTRGARQLDLEIWRWRLTKVCARKSQRSGGRRGSWDAGRDLGAAARAHPAPHIVEMERAYEWTPLSKEGPRSRRNVPISLNPPPNLRTTRMLSEKCLHL